MAKRGIGWAGHPELSKRRKSPPFAHRRSLARFPPARSPGAGVAPAPRSGAFRAVPGATGGTPPSEVGRILGLGISSPISVAAVARMVADLNTPAAPGGSVMVGRPPAARARSPPRGRALLPPLPPSRVGIPDARIGRRRRMMVARDRINLTQGYLGGGGFGNPVAIRIFHAPPSST